MNAWQPYMSPHEEDDYFRGLSALTAETTYGFRPGGDTLLSAMADEVKPGTPMCEHLIEIAVRLKELEVDRLRDIQAAKPPEEKK